MTNRQKWYREEYLKSEHWKSTREWAIRATGYRCQFCGSGIRLHVHHNNYNNLGNEGLSDIKVLCEKCHKIFHGVKSKYYRDSWGEIGKDSGRCFMSWREACCRFEHGGCPVALSVEQYERILNNWACFWAKDDNVRRELSELPIAIHIEGQEICEEGSCIYPRPCRIVEAFGEEYTNCHLTPFHDLLYIYGGHIPDKLCFCSSYRGNLSGKKKENAALDAIHAALSLIRAI